MTRGVLLGIIWAFCLLEAPGQRLVQTVWADYTEAMAEAGIPVEDNQEWLERLIVLSEHPFNLNRAGREELEQLPFLSDSQIEAILSHRYRLGAFQTFLELQGVMGLGEVDVKLLQPFVLLGEAEDALSPHRRVSGQTLFRLQQRWPLAQGYRALGDTVPAAFKGAPVRLMWRQHLAWQKKWDAGWVAEKDPGEPLFRSGIQTVDHFSGYVRYLPAKGVLKQFIVGDYSVRLGQGLGVWTGFPVVQGYDQPGNQMRATGITPYNSAGENGFLRGGAFSLGLNNWNLMGWVDAHRFDGTLVQADSLSAGGLSAIYSTGLHRTQAEIDKRKNSSQWMVGGYLSRNMDRVRLGMGFATLHLSNQVVKSDKPEALYRWHGSRLSSAFADYRVYAHRFFGYGEVVIQTGGAWGTSHGIHFNPGNEVSVALGYRYFSRGFSTLYQQPRARSSNPEGEQGISLGVRFAPFSRWICNASIQTYRYSWLRYLAAAPSSGFDYFVQLRHQLGSHSAFTVRWKQDFKQANRLNPELNHTALSEHKRSQLRLGISTQLERFTLQTLLEKVWFDEVQGVHSRGIWLSQDVKVHWSSWNVALRMAHFDTDDYYSRIYVYEPDVQFAYSVPSRSGRGVLSLLNMGSAVGENLKLWCRLLYVHRLDVNQYGFGPDGVDSPDLFEAKLQVQYRF